MKTGPMANHLFKMAEGGQGVVSLHRFCLRADEARERLAAGWVVHSTSEEHALICVEKRPIGPQASEGHRDRPSQERDAEKRWMRIEREYRLLELAAGAGTPRVFECDQRDDRPPWENAIYLEYVHGVSLYSLIENGIRPDPDQLVALAWALFDLLGGTHGTEGLHARSIAHRDVFADQMLIPFVAGRLDWAHPVLLDLGNSYHPTEDLLDRKGNRVVSSERLAKLGYHPPEASPAYVAPQGCALLEPLVDEAADRRRRLALYQAGDLWCWAMTIGYVSTGVNVFGVSSRGDDSAVTSAEWRAVISGQKSEPPLLHQVHVDIRPALSAALHPDPERRDRAKIGSLLPRTDLQVIDRQRQAAIGVTTLLKEKLDQREREVKRLTRELEEALRSAEQCSGTLAEGFNNKLREADAQTRVAELQLGRALDEQARAESRCDDLEALNCSLARELRDERASIETPMSSSDGAIEQTAAATGPSWRRRTWRAGAPAALLALVAAFAFFVMPNQTGRNDDVRPEGTTTTLPDVVQTQPLPVSEPCVNKEIASERVGAPVRVASEEVCSFEMISDSEALCPLDWLCTYDSNGVRILQEGGPEVSFQASAAIFRFQLAYRDTEAAAIGSGLCPLYAMDHAAVARDRNGTRVDCPDE